MKDIKQIPCKDCLVFPMCKQRAIRATSVFNSSGLFAYLKNNCSILDKAYIIDQIENHKPSEIGMPYSERKFCKAVYRYFKLPPNIYDKDYDPRQPFPM
jgi:hypothetical protein